MNAHQVLVRLLRVYREARPGRERADALRKIAALADDEAGKEEARR